MNPENPERPFPISSSVGWWSLHDRSRIPVLKLTLGSGRVILVDPFDFPEMAQSISEAWEKSEEQGHPVQRRNDG